ncbi:MAG: DUF1275 domain-containing protein [Actinomycetia bacterium]|nr:DUF1275 domain-containing protein [Actinomycetes bacterium]
MVMPVRRPETVAVLLAAASGFVDAFVYLRIFPVFTANQSGNLIFAGVAIGKGHWVEASASLIALAAYIVGAGVGTAAFDHKRQGGRPRFLRALGAEVAVLVTLIVTAAILGRGQQVSRQVDLPVILMIATTSLAMGLQGMALRKVRGVSVLTTGGTGNVTSIGERLGRLGTPRREDGDEAVLGIIGGVVVLYVVGAIAGAIAAAIDRVGPVLLLIPVATVAVALVLELTRVRSGEQPPGAGATQR